MQGSKKQSGAQSDLKDQKKIQKKKILFFSKTQKEEKQVAQKEGQKDSDQEGRQLFERVQERNADDIDPNQNKSGRSSEYQGNMEEQENEQESIIVIGQQDQKIIQDFNISTDIFSECQSSEEITKVLVQKVWSIKWQIQDTLLSDQEKFKKMQRNMKSLNRDDIAEMNLLRQRIIRKQKRIDQIKFWQSDIDLIKFFSGLERLNIQWNWVVHNFQYQGGFQQYCVVRMYHTKKNFWNFSPIFSDIQYRRFKPTQQMNMNFSKLPKAFQSLKAIRRWMESYTIKQDKEQQEPRGTPVKKVKITFQSKNADKKSQNNQKKHQIVEKKKQNVEKKKETLIPQNTTIDKSFYSLFARKWSNPDDQRDQFFKNLQKSDFQNAISFIKGIQGLQNTLSIDLIPIKKDTKSQDKTSKPKKQEPVLVLTKGCQQCLKTIALVGGQWTKTQTTNTPSKKGFFNPDPNDLEDVCQVCSQLWKTILQSPDVTKMIWQKIQELKYFQNHGLNLKYLEKVIQNIKQLLGQMKFIRYRLYSVNTKNKKGNYIQFVVQSYNSFAAGKDYLKHRTSGIHFNYFLQANGQLTLSSIKNNLVYQDRDRPEPTSDFLLSQLYYNYALLLLIQNRWISEAKIKTTSTEWTSKTLPPAAKVPDLKKISLTFRKE